jgi:hypothetical protein
MRNDPVRGRTIAFSFDDGPMAGKTFEHRFDDRGTVTFRAAGDQASDAAKDPAHGGPGTAYEVATLRDGVCAISYLSSAGTTLTVVLDFATNKLIAFSSNEETLSLQRGCFHEMPAVAEARSRTIV